MPCFISPPTAIRVWTRRMVRPPLKKKLVLRTLSCHLRFSPYIAIGLGLVSILMSIVLLWWQRAANYNIYVNWKAIELSAYIMRIRKVVYLHFRACFATLICMLHSAGDSGGLLNQCPPECVGCVGGSGGHLAGCFSCVLIQSCVYVCCKIPYKVIYFQR